ncbi:MAG: hypothetical protein IJK93_08255 [Muribaculaceae bacterium]|nr:hypothetical protein [Muribaculaceae bacterium]
MKKLYILILLMVMATVAHAQRIQVVDTDGLPIAAVCVTNENGALVGTTDSEGWLDDVNGQKHLYFSHVAFAATNIDTDNITDGRVVMKDANYELSELVVKPKELLYVQTYFRCIYVCEDGPIYFRAGVVDNTYEIAKKKISTKTRSVSKGASGFLRFVLSTLVGKYIDEWAAIDTLTNYNRIIADAQKGALVITEDASGRRMVSDTISLLGYISDDLEASQRTTHFDKWTYRDHKKATERAAKEAATGKKQKEKTKKFKANHGYYEVYNIDENGRSRIDDLVMKQALVTGHFERTEQDYVILFETYTIKRDYIDKKEFKQTRKENQVDMDINELRRLEQVNHIPPLSPNLRAAVDELFKKDLDK